MTVVGQSSSGNFYTCGKDSMIVAAQDSSDNFPEYYI